KLQRTAPLRTAGVLLVFSAGFFPGFPPKWIFLFPRPRHTPRDFFHRTNQMVGGGVLNLHRKNHPKNIYLVNITEDPPSINGVLGSVQIDLGTLSSGTLATTMNTEANTTQVVLTSSGSGANATNIVTSVTNNVTSTWATQTVAAMSSTTITLCD